ncbi:MAG: thioester reductase domain-containing protein [Planctomycetes bacterium]|nr:thioester reductase domain-containing protein [Planctomycetota bacterium]
MTEGAQGGGELNLEQKRELLARMLRQKIAARGNAPAEPACATANLDLDAEARLDPSFTTEGLPRHWPAQPVRLLLTGATGFLGGYLLHELIERSQAKIVCLVRCASPIDGLQRILSNLTANQLSTQGVANRVEVIPGDASKPRLGLTEQQFHSLAGSVDWIYHNAAVVNFAYPYHMLRDANVGSLAEVLKLATLVKLKPLHLVSSLGIFSSIDYRDQIVEEDAELHIPSSLDCGYVQTKWVSDKLAVRARKAGLPVAIYRLGLVTGDTKNGIGATDGLIFRMVKGCIQLGLAPDLDIHVEALPVDYAGLAIAHLSLESDALGKNFHLANSYTLPWNTLVDYIRAVGYQVRTVSYDEWKQAMIDDAKQSSDNAMYTLLPVMQEPSSQERLFSTANTPRFSCVNTERGLSDIGLSCPPMDAELLGIYFHQFISSGYLQPPPS